MKKIYIAVILLFVATTIQAQVSIGYFPFQSILSITSNSEKKVWADYKIETNTFFTNMNMEFSLKYNFKQQASVNYYFAPGIAINFANPSTGSSLANGYFIDFGSRIKPLQKNKHVQIVFELSPYINTELKSGNFRSRLGLAYNL